MKLHKDFLLRKIGDTAVLVPFGRKQVDFNGMVTLNKTGTFIVEMLQNGEKTREELIRKVTERFEVDADIAAADTDQFLADLRANGVLDELAE